MSLKQHKKLELGHATTAAQRLAKTHGITDPRRISDLGGKMRHAMLHGGLGTHVKHYATRQDSGPKGDPFLTATLSKYAGLKHDERAYQAGLPKKTGKAKGFNLPPDQQVQYVSSPSDITEEKGCTCGDSDKKCPYCSKKLMKQLKERYLGENVIPAPSRTTFTKERTVKNLSEYNLDSFVGKKALVETLDGTYCGIFGTLKGGYALFENETVKRALNLDTVTKFVCEGVKFSVNFNLGEDTALLQEKIVHRGGKVLVTNEAGTKVLGTHSSEESAKKQLNAIHANQARQVHESSEMLLKENIRDRFFATEEVVHKDHEFTMTDDEIYERDQIADDILSRSGKWAGTLQKLKAKKGETKEEAAHRFATYIVVCKRRGSTGGGGYEKGLFHGDDKKDSRRTRRSGRDLVKRGPEAEARRKKETVHFSNVKTRKERKFKRNVIKSGKKGVIKPQFKQAAADLKAKKKAIPAYMFRKTANLKGAEGTTRAQFAKKREANEIRRNKYRRTN